jgi:hypothetical protein
MPDPKPLPKRLIALRVKVHDAMPFFRIRIRGKIGPLLAMRAGVSFDEIKQPFAGQNFQDKFTLTFWAG